MWGAGFWFHLCQWIIYNGFTRSLHQCNKSEFNRGYKYTGVNLKNKRQIWLYQDSSTHQGSNSNPWLASRSIISPPSVLDESDQRIAEAVPGILRNTEPLRALKPCETERHCHLSKLLDLSALVILPGSSWKVLILSPLSVELGRSHFQSRAIHKTPHAFYESSSC